MKIIEKKVLPEYFDKILSGDKTFELRLADFECSQGDTICLIEIDPNTKKPTGREINRKIGYVGRTKDFDFWPESDIQKYGYQVISLLDD